MKKRILKILSEKGILAEPEAIDALANSPDALKCIEAILQDPQNRPLVLTKADVEGFMQCAPKKRASEPKELRDEEQPVSGPASEHMGEIKILKDITGDSTCVGNVIDFVKLFNDRFSAIKRMVAKRRELSGLMSISRAMKVERDVKFVAIVNDIRTTKNGHTMLEVEDEDDKIQVLIMKGSKKGLDSFVKDEVLGIVGSLSKDREVVIAKDIIRPDVPINSGMASNGSDSVVAFVGDIHVGSTEFLQEAWMRFMKWLRQDSAAEDIRYIVMPGDLVDGIGIYPGQEDELIIEDVYDQYTELARLVAMIPQRIRIVMMPGNHDAVRLAEPQPALPRQVTSMFDTRVMFAGNPCYLEIEGRTILAYHGRSMDDFIGNIHALSHQRPDEVMKEMLRRRHLAPIYGGLTALAPEQKDYLVIDKVPNVFVTGHVHTCTTAEYRGIKLINASAWQAQTAYQRMHNQTPDPAKVPMMCLGTGETWVEDFSE
jgi:DNA polymerase II small subunit